MCHLQDKLALGGQLDWLARLQSTDDEGLKDSVRGTMPSNHRPLSDERKCAIAFTQKHFESDDE